MVRLNIGAGMRRKRGFNLAAIPNCEFWIDASRTDTHTYAGGTNLSQVNDLSGKNRHMTKTGASNETTYPAYNAAEKAVSFNNNAALDQMIAGAAGDWNFMHNGNGCTILLLVKVDPAQAANGVILSTSSEASSGIGTNIWYFNTSQQYNVSTRNGTGYTHYNSGAANSLLKGGTQLISVHMEFRTGNPSDLVSRWNGATDLQVGNLTTYSAANSTGPLFIGKLQADANFKCKMLFKKCAIFSRRLSKAEENAILEDWAKAEGLTLTRYADRTLAVIAGQNNAKGHGAISDTGFSATPGVTNAAIFNNTGFSFSALQAGTNNDAYNTSSLGIEMNFAKQFTTLSGQPINLVKYAVDGTGLNLWSNVSGNFTSLQTMMKRAVWNLEDAGYVVKPVFIWYQGESDAADTTLTAAYGTSLQTFLSQILAVYGFYQAQTYIVQIHQSPTASGTGTVRSAQLTAAMTTPFSTYAHLVEVDDIADHIDQNNMKAVALNAVGNRIARRILGVAE